MIRNSYSRRTSSRSISRTYPFKWTRFRLTFTQSINRAQARNISSRSRISKRSIRHLWCLKHGRRSLARFSHNLPPSGQSSMEWACWVKCQLKSIMTCHASTRVSIVRLSTPFSGPNLRTLSQVQRKQIEMMILARSKVRRTKSKNYQRSGTALEHYFLAATCSTRVQFKTSKRRSKALTRKIASCWPQTRVSRHRRTTMWELPLSLQVWSISPAMPRYDQGTRLKAWSWMRWNLRHRRSQRQKLTTHFPHPCRIHHFTCRLILDQTERKVPLTYTQESLPTLLESLRCQTWSHSRLTTASPSSCPIRSRSLSLKLSTNRSSRGLRVIQTIEWQPLSRYNTCPPKSYSSKRSTHTQHPKAWEQPIRCEATISTRWWLSRGLVSLQLLHSWLPLTRRWAPMATVRSSHGVDLSRASTTNIHPEPSSSISIKAW